jgi:ribosomal protein S18 acetylase RimI-like enzyme
MDEIKMLSELEELQVDQAINVFIEGFFYIFKSISKDTVKLHKLFKNSFDYNMTYAFLLNGEAVGFIGLANHHKRPITLNKDAFSEILGGFPGKIAYKTMSAALEKINVNNPDEIYIDYIAIKSNFRSQGIGSKLIGYVHDSMGCKYIKLEVFTKNTRARAFYERLGFKAIKVKTNFMLLLKGFGRPITMLMDVNKQAMGE